MNILDIVLVAPVCLGLVFGLSKGLIKELMSLAAIVLGIMGARWFEPQVSPWLRNAFDLQEGMAQAVAYLLLFVAIALVLLMVARLLDKFFSAIALGGLNKLLGGVFGALKWALVASVLLNVFDTFDRRFAWVEPQVKRESLLYDGMLHFGPRLWEETKDLLPAPQEGKGAEQANSDTLHT